MKANFQGEVVNTLHYIGTGKFYVNKKGERKEEKAPIIHRRLFLTALPTASIFGVPNNCRIVLRNLNIYEDEKDDKGAFVLDNKGKRKGKRKRKIVGEEIRYSLSGREEFDQSYWDKSPKRIANDYSPIVDTTGRQKKPWTQQAILAFLRFNLPDADKFLDELANGEPLEGDDRWTALERYGYVRPVYEDDEQLAEAA